MDEDSLCFNGGTQPVIAGSLDSVATGRED